MLIKIDCKLEDFWFGTKEYCHFPSNSNYWFLPPMGTKIENIYCTSEYANHVKTGENIHIRHGWHFFLLTSWRKRVAGVLIFLVSWSWLCCVSTALVLFSLLHFLFFPLLLSSGIPGQETGRHTWVICGHLPIISYKRPCVATCQCQMIPCGVVHASTCTFVFVLWQLYCSSPVHSLLSVLPWETVTWPCSCCVFFSFPLEFPALFVCLLPFLFLLGF